MSLGGASDRSAWGRVIPADLDIQQGGTVSPTSKGHVSGFQAGTDLLATPNWRAGVCVGQLDGDAKVDGQRLLRRCGAAGRPPSLHGCADAGRWAGRTARLRLRPDGRHAVSTVNSGKAVANLKSLEVVAGHVLFEVDGRRFIGRRGDRVSVPSGAVRAYVNVTGTGARQRVITQPGFDAVAFFRGLAEALDGDTEVRGARLRRFGARGADRLPRCAAGRGRRAMAWWRPMSAAPGRPKQARNAARSAEDYQ